MKTKGKIILLAALIIAQVMGAVNPLLGVAEVTAFPAQEISVKEIGGLSGIMTLVCSNISESIKTLINAGYLVSSIGTQSKKGPQDAKSAPSDRIFFNTGVSGSAFNLKLLNIGSDFTANSAVPALSQAVDSIHLNLLCLMFLMLFLCRQKLTRWHAALARSSTGDAIISNLFPVCGIKTLICVPRQIGVFHLRRAL